MPGLGRKFSPDVRDKKYLLKSHIPEGAVRPSTKTWRLLWHGDQGDSPHCVGYGWYGCLRASPILNRQPLPDPLYFEAQKYDEWPGEDYDGTSVRGGAKALQQEYHELATYSWAFTISDVLDWLGLHGPCVFGTNWYDSMFNPDPKTGLVTLGGEIVGGHCYVVLGYDDYKKRLVCQNSWGLSWGIKGRFLLSYEDAQRLITEDGEACAPTEVLI